MKRTIMFNMSERELCGKCGYPEGFCKHTIEKEYQELCPDTPLDEHSIWQLVRTYAICATEKVNIWDCTDKEIKELRDMNSDLRTENLELRHFRKHIEDILLNTVKGNVQTKVAHNEKRTKKVV